MWKKKDGEDKLDIELIYASAGSNKQMYDMYNLSMNNQSVPRMNTEANTNNY